MDINHLHDRWFAKSFSYSVGCLFILLIISFAVQKFEFDVAHLLIFAFVVCAFGVISKKTLPWPMSGLLPMFSSRNFMVLGLMFKSLTHFKLILIYCVRVQFYSFTCGCPVFECHLLKRLSFPHYICLAPLLLIDHICMHFFWALYSVSPVCVFFYDNTMLFW